MRASRSSSPGSRGRGRDAGCVWPRSSRRTCRTTRWCAVTAARSGARSTCSARLRASRPRACTTQSCSSRAATGRRSSSCVADRQGGCAPVSTRRAAVTSRTRRSRPSRSWRATSTSSSPRVPAPPPRSTCAAATTSTWGSRAASTCPSPSSATSTAAVCSPRCTGRGRCSTTTIVAISRRTSSTSFAATRPSSSPASTRSRDVPACPAAACCHGSRMCGSTLRMPCRSVGGDRVLRAAMQTRRV